MSKERMQQLAGINEATNPYEEYGQELESSFRKHFPDSFFRYQVKMKPFGPTSSSVYMIFAYGKDRSEWANGIFENDPIASKVFIYNVEIDSPDVQFASGGSVWDTNSRKSVKVYRKITGDIPTTLRKWDDFFAKLAATVKSMYSDGF